jgi:hypothetical protein
MQKMKNRTIVSETYFFSNEQTFVSYSYSLKDDGAGMDITYMEQHNATLFGKIDTENKEKNNYPTKTKFMIPKGGYIFVNGKRMTAEQARKQGLDVETF